MMTEADARSFAESAFPDAPEQLAKRLGVEIRISALGGCDGWCLIYGQKAIVRLNRNSSKVRRRFTLAHELGHLILGVPTLVGETYEDMLRSNSEDERRVNDLASALLIPAKVAKEFLSELPVITASLKKLAKKADVSDLATAIRVCNLAREIGLLNASVVLFDGDSVRWQWSKTISMSDQTAVRLLSEARKASPMPYREDFPDSGDIVVASMIENPSFGTATLFVQILPAKEGLRISRDERRCILESELFHDDPKLRERVSGLIGAHKKRTSNVSLDESVSDFWNRNHERLKSTSLNSEKGQEYIKLRISEWF